MAVLPAVKLTGQGTDAAHAYVRESWRTAGEYACARVSGTHTAMDDLSRFQTKLEFVGKVLGLRAANILCSILLLLRLLIMDLYSEAVHSRGLAEGVLVF